MWKFFVRGGAIHPAAAALRFVVSRLGERGPRCRLGAACLVGDGRRLRFSPGPGESAFSSATGARLRVRLFAAIGGREADSHGKVTALPFHSSRAKCKEYGINQRILLEHP